MSWLSSQLGTTAVRSGLCTVYIVLNLKGHKISCADNDLATAGVWVYGTGITVYLSRNNVIMHNHTYGNATEGIGSWESSGNLLLNPDGICRNTWENNQFQTEIGLPGCMGIAVELDEKDVCALHDDHDD